MANVLCPLLRLRTLIALMLAFMALHAVPAEPLSLHRDNGPAVSAGSVEMAVPVRRPLASEPRAAPVYPPLANGTPEPIPLATNENALGLAWPAADYGRPAPPRRVLVPATPPRGPPLS